MYLWILLKVGKTEWHRTVFYHLNAHESSSDRYKYINVLRRVIAIHALSWGGHGGKGSAICSYLSTSSCLGWGCSRGGSHRCRTGHPSRRPARSRACQAHTRRQLREAFQRRRILIHVQTSALRAGHSDSHSRMYLHLDANRDVFTACQCAINQSRVHRVCFCLAISVTKLVQVLE